MNWISCKCSAVWYCSKECKKKDTKNHTILICQTERIKKLSIATVEKAPHQYLCDLYELWRGSIHPIIWGYISHSYSELFSTEKPKNVLLLKVACDENALSFAIRSISIESIDTFEFVETDNHKFSLFLSNIVNGVAFYCVECDLDGITHWDQVFNLPVPFEFEYHHEIERLKTMEAVFLRISSKKNIQERVDKAKKVFANEFQLGVKNITCTDAFDEFVATLLHVNESKKRKYYKKHKVEIYVKMSAKFGVIDDLLSFSVVEDYESSPIVPDGTIPLNCVFKTGKTLFGAEIELESGMLISYCVNYVNIGTAKRKKKGEILFQVLKDITKEQALVAIEKIQLNLRNLESLHDFMAPDVSFRTINKVF